MIKKTGRIQFYDPMNENYRVRDVQLPKRVSALRAAVRGLGIRDTRKWRQRAFFDQGDVPACTGYSSATLVAAEPVRPSMTAIRALDPMKWYQDNVKQDRSEGRFYSEGATVLAAMKVGQQYGYWGEYRWAYTIEELLSAVHDTSPVVVGTNWYSSMWDRDAEGVVRITPSARNVGGHMWCINGYNPRKGLLRHPSTWDDGYYEIPVDVMVRLLHEDGECGVVRELVPLIP